MIFRYLVFIWWLFDQFRESFEKVQGETFDFKLEKVWLYREKGIILGHVIASNGIELTRSELI